MKDSEFRFDLLCEIDFRGVILPLPLKSRDLYSDEERLFVEDEFNPADCK